MAFSNLIPGAVVSCQVDSGVSAITLDSKGNYSSGGLQFGTCVKLNASGKIGDVQICTTADNVFGIAIDDPARAPSSAVRVATHGVVKCRAGAAISLGDLVYSGDSSGRVKTAPAAGASQSYIVGIAMEAATQIEDLISVRLMLGSATNVNA